MCLPRASAPALLARGQVGHQPRPSPPEHSGGRRVEVNSDTPAKTANLGQTTVPAPKRNLSHLMGQRGVGRGGLATVGLGNRTKEREGI